MTETRIRRAQATDAGAIAVVHVQAWREAYAGLMPAETLASLSVDERAARWRRILGEPDPATGTATFVAGVPGASTVAFGSCGQQRAQDLAGAGFDGEFQAIYVLRAAQRRGIGRALMAEMARHLAGRSFRGASLWVLSGNHPACRFYEALGGRVVGEREERRADGLVLAQLAYGWTNLGPIRAAAQRFAAGRPVQAITGSAAAKAAAQGTEPPAEREHVGAARLDVEHGAG